MNNDEFCIVCGTMESTEIIIECGRALNKTIFYRYLCRDCFSESEIKIDLNGHMKCLWCEKELDYSNPPWNCVQLMISHGRVFSRPCITCWNKHGVSLD